MIDGHDQYCELETSSVETCNCGKRLIESLLRTPVRSADRVYAPASIDAVRRVNYDYFHSGKLRTMTFEFSARRQLKGDDFGEWIIADIRDPRNSDRS